MKQMIVLGTAFLLFAIFLSGCAERPLDTAGTGKQGDSSGTPAERKAASEGAAQTEGAYTADTLIADVISDPVFGNYGQLIFPVDDMYYSGNTLGELSLAWYNNIDPNKTVEICNYMKDHAAAGNTIFYHAEYGNAR